MATWFITGCSTGFGRLLAEAALADGHNVVATARDVSSIQDLADQQPDRVLALRLDVTNAAHVTEAASAAEARFGSVEVLVNNAGYGYRAAVEEGESEAVRRLFETHFFGPVMLIQALLPGMRGQHSGTIVNISSIGARMSPAGSGYYSAVKAAMEGMTLSLRREVAPLGITAMVVEPGGFRTDFAGRSLTQAAVPIADYAETAGLRRIENDTSHGRQPGDPIKAARAIIDVIQSPEPPFMLVLGSDALAAFRSALDALTVDLDAWESVSTATEVDE